MTLSSSNKFPNAQPVDPVNPKPINPDDKSGFPEWAILVIAIAGLIIILAAIIFTCIRRKRGQSDEANAIYKEVEDRQTGEDTYQ